MKEISISVTFEADRSMPIIDQIKAVEKKYLPEEMEITDINFEREWLEGKTRITFKGVEL